MPDNTSEKKGKNHEGRNHYSLADFNLKNPFAATKYQQKRKSGQKNYTCEASVTGKWPEPSKSLTRQSRKQFKNSQKQFTSQNSSQSKNSKSLSQLMRDW